MTIGKEKWRATLSWLFVGTLLGLCGVLGVLQYRWIDEVSVASRERMRGSLQASLNRLSQDLNSEIATACRAVIPADWEPNSPLAENELASRYDQWEKTARNGRLFLRIAIAVPDDDSVALRSFNPEKAMFQPAEWPEAWTATRGRLDFGRSPDGWRRRDPSGPPQEDEGTVFAVPLFGMRPPGPPPGPFDRRDIEWLIFELNPAYVRDVLLPELLQRHLGTGGSSEYDVEVLTRSSHPSAVYLSDPVRAKQIAGTADASIRIFDPRFEQMLRSGGPPGGRDRGFGPGRGPGPDMGRWQMSVRHRSGSLEAVVSRAKWRNVAVTAGVLLLMVASVWALIRFTRRAQKLAEMQVEFVAGVSHELRTPLTAIHTAAFNLRGRVANNPVQVERYGAMIQQESARLKELVEQVLDFAGGKTRRVIQAPEPVSVERVIEEAMEASKAVTHGQYVIEKSVDSGLPAILGDARALKRALQNLLSNAAKYGTEGGNWIGVFASAAGEQDQPVVEIRVADRGPGIPEDEQKHIFDPFFRGRRAVQDQVHGTGLGLYLVKSIVEAHGGTVCVKSEPAKGTEFIVRIPAAPQERIDEFADSISGG
jgi:signal transduction histidine kinase